MKALRVIERARVYVYSKAMHLGCSFPKLSRIVREELGQEVENGDLFVFLNSKANYVKILFWSAGGPCILAKKLYRGRFTIELNEKKLNVVGLEKVLDHPVV
jgi:transposase